MHIFRDSLVLRKADNILLKGNKGQFWHCWVLLGTRKLVPKKLKTKFFIKYSHKSLQITHVRHRCLFHFILKHSILNKYLNTHSPIHCLLHSLILFLSINWHIAECWTPKIKNKIEHRLFCMQKYKIIKNLLVASFAMGWKRTSGISHNKNAKMYKTTDRQSVLRALNHLPASSLNIANLFIKHSKHSEYDSHKDKVNLFFYL